jgi:branched-chain amino acid transport system permease protein
LAVVVIAFPFIFNSSRTNLAAVVLIYAMVGISLVILTGWSGNISLGQWAIVGLGALLTQRLAATAAPLDFFIILIVAGLAGAALSLLIGLPALRIRGLFLGVTTLAFAIAAKSWIFQWKILTTDQSIVRPALFGFIDTTSERSFYFVCVAGLLFALFVARNLRRSRWGRNLIAMRDNETQAQSLGMRLTASRLGAFAISGFIASLAGALYAYNEQSVDFTRFDPRISLVMFSMVVIGGMGSLAGPVLGAIYVLGIQYFMPVSLQLFGTGFGLLVLLLVFPGGLGQIFYMLRDRYLVWVAERRDLIVPSLIADRREVPPPMLAPTDEQEEQEERTKKAPRKALAASRRKS